MRYLVIALVLIGCGGSAYRAPPQVVDRCEAYGFQPGTESYAVCRMQLDMQQKAINDQLLGTILLNNMQRYPR